MLLYALSLLLYLGILLLHYRKSDFSIFFWLTIGVVFYVPVAFHVFGGGYYDYPKYIVEEAVFFSVISNTVYLIGLIILGGGRGRVFSKNLKDEVVKLEKVFVGASCLILFFLIFSAYFKFGSLVNVGWRDVKSAPFYIPLLYGYYVTSISFFILFLRKRYTLLFIQLLFVIAVVLIYQSRSLLLPPLISFAVYYLFIKRNVVVVSAGLTVFLVLFLGLQQYRYVGADDFDFNDAYKGAKFKVANRGGELGLVDVFYFLLDSRDTVEGAFEGRTFQRMAFFYLPTGYLDLKPPDFSYLIYGAYTGDYGVGGSMHPTYYGMMYANFGWFGCGAILFLLLLHKGFVFFFNAINVNSFWGAPLYSSSLILMARGSVYNSFVVLVSGLALFAFLFYVSFLLRDKNVE